MKLAWRTKPSLVNSAISTVRREHRLDPRRAPAVGASAAAGRTGSRRVRSARSRAVSVSSVRVVEAGADAAGERAASPLPAIGTPTSSAPNVDGAVAVARGVPADRQLDPSAVLDLAPVLRPRARPVGGAEPLGHHAFEALRSRVASSSASPSPTRYGGHHPVVARFDELVEQAAPVLVGQVDRVGAVRPTARRTAGARPRVADPTPLFCTSSKLGSAVVVEHDELAVEDRRRARSPTRRGGRTPASGPSRRGRRCSAGAPCRRRCGRSCGSRPT